VKPDREERRALRRSKRIRFLLTQRRARREEEARRRREETGTTPEMWEELNEEARMYIRSLETRLRGEGGVQ